MKIQNQALKIRYRSNPKDIIYTPVDLAIKCISLVPFVEEDTILDPAAGKGAFCNNFPQTMLSESYDILTGNDFFKQRTKVDWIITNPPYSILGDWLEHSCKIARKGFAYLIGSYSITPKRLELIESYGFKLTHMHICKVSQWFGMTAFCIFEKSADEKMKFTYDRKVWQSKDIYKGSNIKEKTIMEFK